MITAYCSKEPYNVGLGNVHISLSRSRDSDIRSEKTMISVKSYRDKFIKDDPCL